MSDQTKRAEERPHQRRPLSRVGAPAVVVFALLGATWLLAQDQDKGIGSHAKSPEASKRHAKWPDPPVQETNSQTPPKQPDVKPEETAAQQDAPSAPVAPAPEASTPTESAPGGPSPPDATVQAVAPPAPIPGVILWDDNPATEPLVAALRAAVADARSRGTLLGDTLDDESKMHIVLASTSGDDALADMAPQLGAIDPDRFQLALLRDALDGVSGSDPNPSSGAGRLAASVRAAGLELALDSPRLVAILGCGDRVAWVASAPAGPLRAFKPAVKSLAILLSRSPPQFPKAVVDAEAQLIKVQDGSKSTLRSLLSRSEQPVLLVFWADYCAPCIKEMPELQALQERLSGRVRVVGIVPESTPSNPRVTAVLSQQGVKYDNYTCETMPPYTKLFGHARPVLPAFAVYDTTTDVVLARSIGDVKTSSTRQVLERVERLAQAAMGQQPKEIRQ